MYIQCIFLTSFISNTGAGPEKWSLVPCKSVLFWDSPLEVSSSSPLGRHLLEVVGLRSRLKVGLVGPCPVGEGLRAGHPTLVNQVVLLPRAQSNVTAAPRRLTGGTCFLRGSVRPSPLHLAWPASLKTESPRAETTLCSVSAPIAVLWGTLVTSSLGTPPCPQGQTVTWLPGCPDCR